VIKKAAQCPVLFMCVVRSRKDEKCREYTLTPEAKAS
jgi:hypothetical protein